MDIFISGSLAYDRIMDFPGHFADHILPDKIHVLNVCFNINGLVEKFGGTAGNIAYTLACLGERPYIVATSGEDFDRYEKRLLDHLLPTQWIRRIPGVLTAGAYITTDLDDNQITAFNPGAMAHEADLPSLNSSAGDGVVFIGPGNKNDMAGFAAAAREASVDFFFDPGQSLNIWQKDELRKAVAGALCFISNDYELSLFLQITKWSMDDLYRNVQVVITTRGPEGAILDMHRDKVLIPAVPAGNVLDPTGAGDAFRAGLLKGWSLKLPWDICCQMGATAATYAVEHYGTQEHVLDWDTFCRRYDEHFGPLLC
ncbi:MAG: carbohydrate kinase family protein [Syntrophobacteraceae bacterium]|nr:carbohydrate kinase family protein [Syntrophobacteraceae bacterium]